MKLFLLVLTLSMQTQAQVIDLGMLDSGKSLLDQRYKMNFTDNERISSLGKFYFSKELDFFKNMETDKDIVLGNPNEDWINLLEGHK